MCDYSLELVASRPAKVGDKLVSTSFPHTITAVLSRWMILAWLFVCFPAPSLLLRQEVRCETGMLFAWEARSQGG